MAFQTKTFDQIVQRMITWITNHTTKITDFNLGSSVRTILESFAWVIKEIVADIFIAFRNSLKNFIYESFDFIAKEAIKSSGTVRFSANGASIVDILIPINTVVETADGIGFVTTEEGVLLAGNVVTLDIPMRALVAGESGNINASTVINIVTAISGIDAVTNTVPTTGGQDAETETGQRERFKKHVKNLARCTVLGIESGAEKVNAVFQAQLVETATKGLLYLYVDDGSGGASSTLITDVQNIIEGNNTEENPGYRGAGIVIEYYAVNKISVSVTQTVYVKKGADVVAAKQAIEVAQAEFINSRKMGEDLIKEQLEAEAINISEVVDIEMSLPVANIEVFKGSVVKTTTFLTTIIEWEDLT